VRDEQHFVSFFFSRPAIYCVILVQARPAPRPRRSISVRSTCARLLRHRECPRPDPPHHAFQAKPLLSDTTTWRIGGVAPPPSHHFWDPATQTIGGFSRFF
jgi:hypothetical protein